MVSHVPEPMHAALMPAIDAATTIATLSTVRSVPVATPAENHQTETTQIAWVPHQFEANKQWQEQHAQMHSVLRIEFARTETNRVE